MNNKMGLFGFGKPKTKEDYLKQIAKLERELASAKAFKATRPASDRHHAYSYDKQYYTRVVEHLKGEIAALKAEMKMVK